MELQASCSFPLLNSIEEVCWLGEGQFPPHLQTWLPLIESLTGFPPGAAFQGLSGAALGGREAGESDGCKLKETKSLLSNGSPTQNLLQDQELWPPFLNVIYCAGFFSFTKEYAILHCYVLPLVGHTFLNYFLPECLYQDRVWMTRTVDNGQLTFREFEWISKFPI